MMQPACSGLWLTGAFRAVQFSSSSILLWFRFLDFPVAQVMLHDFAKTVVLLHLNQLLHKVLMGMKVALLRSKAQIVMNMLF